MTIITTKRTSYNSAEVEEPIILHETTTTRKVFKAMIARRPGEEPLVRGVLLYQKKSKEGWEDVKDINLSSLKSGEGVHIDLPSAQLVLLRSGLENLSKVAGLGLHQGETKFAITSENTKDLLDQLARLENKEIVIDNLNSMEPSDFENLSSIVGVGRLKRAMSFWDANKNNDNEEFWQKFFQSNSWILSQIFCHPLVLLSGKGYVGGKGLHNTGGKITDFIYQNNLTKNTAIIEIKTPLSQLVASEYRNGIYGMSGELTGSIAQVLDQKDKFQKQFYGLREETDEEFISFNPKCIVLCGSLEFEVLNKDKLKSFELFRNCSKDVEIVTYNELFAKIKLLLEQLEGVLDSVDTGEDNSQSPFIEDNVAQDSSPVDEVPAVNYDADIKPEDPPF